MYKSNIFTEDMELISNDRNIDFSKFNGKTILVTGATGLIGYNLVSALLYYGICAVNAPKVIALVRNLEKAKNLFSDQDTRNLKYIVSDVCNLNHITDPIDFIIHGASQTSSKAFVKEPIETIFTSINGTKNMLELAKEKQVEGLIYLSSMEVYGSPETDEKITENYHTNLNTMEVRSSYPESKRMCESLCCAYASEFQIPAKVIRLTQTFGLGVSYNDNRIFAELARCAIEKKDIILNTKGDTKRSYLYTADAVRAILTVLLKGQSGQAYNAANESTYCSIYKMASMVAEKCANGKITVRREANQNILEFGYAPILKMNLDTKKLKDLGWKAEVDLYSMYNRLISTLMTYRNCLCGNES